MEGVKGVVAKVAKDNNDFLHLTHEKESGDCLTLSFLLGVSLSDIWVLLTTKYNI